MATAEVKKLAALARISVSEEELPKFIKEFEAILAYIGQLEALDLSIDRGEERLPLRNVMRKDGEPHPPGMYTEKLAEQFPKRENDALVVKQIISHE